MPKTNHPATPVVRKRIGVVPVSEAGTGASNSLDAVLNLGGIYVPYMNQAMYAGQLDPYAVVYKNQLPLFCVSTPTVSGEKVLYTGQVTAYNITNFDSRTYYTVRANVGSVLLNGSTINYTAPLDPQVVTFEVNQKVFTVNVRLPWPLTPTLAGATSGSNSNAVANLASTPFQMVAGGATHVSSDWEVAADVSFTTLVASAYNDTVNKTIRTFTGLSLSAQYYFRVRYKASDGEYSDWCTPLALLTKTRYSPTTEERKAIASDRSANDNFGRAVAVDATGTRVIIGAPNADETSTSNNGAVYIFRRDGSTWTQEAILNQATTNNQYFGDSVAIDDTGTRIVIGMYGFNSAQGCVYVYTRSGTSWNLEVQLQSTNDQNDDRFGFSVACNSDCSWIITGAPRNNSGSTRSGTVYTWRRDGTIWFEENKLIQNDPVNNDYFGYSVALDQTGTRAIVGAYLADPSAISSAGSAYVFLRTGNVWAQEAKLVASDSSTNAQFGFAVDMDSSGQRVVIGANLATVSALTTAGAAYIFQRSGTNWTQEVKLIPSDLATADNFGTSVAISGDGLKVVIGAPFQNPSAIADAGCVYVFNKIAFEWLQETKVTASDLQASDNFGYALDLSEDSGRLIVGAFNEDPSGTSNAGSSYIYA